MAIPKLGKLIRLEQIKDVWNHEATSFTPWLAEEDNIQLVADAIGLDELVVEAQEKNVGPFRADILCKAPSTDRFVLIENQLERTDHSHLGQILTYAAGLGACTIVWIAKNFTNEHRATLDWLNEITDEKFNFFGLEIELWRIGDSEIAANFNVVSKPNEWTRDIQNAAKELETSQHTPRDLLLRDFWTALKICFERQKSKVRPQKPLPQSWTNIALGRSGIYLVATARVKKQTMSVQVVIHGPNRAIFFRELLEQKEIIESEIGHNLLWLQMPEKSESHIRLTIENVDVADKTQWDKHIDWMAQAIEKFHRVFSSRVRNLGSASEDA